MNIIRKSTCSRLFAASILFLCASPSAQAENVFHAHKYITFDKYGNYGSLTDYAKELIKTSRDTVRARKVVFNQNFKKFESIFHAAHVNRLAKGNMFLYGPPGGAKSKFVKWIFSQEEYPAFELQMHQMMSEQAFVGSQNYEATKTGRFEINTQGSLADFKLALIDEIDKGNPAALAALLSLLNERKILAGNKVINSPLETIFSTSNANLYDIHQQFAENGLRSTATALLNRFNTIAFIPNWISIQDQALLDDNYLKNMDKLFDLCCGNDQDLNNKKSEKLTLNWDALRELALCILRPTEEFLSISRDFTEIIRSQTIQARKDLQDALKMGTDDEALPYYPTAELTERLRQRIHDIVVMSVLFDLLGSPIVDDLNAFENALKNMKNHRLPIGPLSLWRAYLTLTTVTSGQTQLQFPTAYNQLKTTDLVFGNFFETYKPNDSREEKNIQYLKDEQKRFKNVFLKAIEDHKNVLEDSAEVNALFSCVSDNVGSNDFYDIERLLFDNKR